jgi:hypothetical protein
MKAVVTGVDVYLYSVDGTVFEALRGDTIDVSDAEFDRGADWSPPGLSKPGKESSSDDTAKPKTKAELVAKLEALGVDFDPKAKVADLAELLAEHTADDDA